MGIFNARWFSGIVSIFQQVTKERLRHKRIQAEQVRQKLVINSPDYAAADETGAVPVYAKNR